jgi:serine/threonine protein kinase
MAAKVLDNRYKLIKKLGAGGFGHTYVARDMRRPGQPMCVVKHLKPASEDAEFIREARRLFNTEAEVLEKLGKHDQIPQLLAYFEENQQFFLVQEFIEGTPLSQEWTTPEPKKITEAEAIALLKDVLGILEFVHNEGVIHRDIKPDNLIRRSSDQKIVLIDFGAVKAFQSENAQLESQNGQSRFTVSIGTPGYMASEQMAGRPNFASDLYSLGMVVIRGLTGIEPTELPTNPDTGEVVWKDKAKVSNGLAMVLTRMTRYSYPQRFQSAREVLQGITAFCPNEELPTPTTIKNTTHLSQSRKSTLHEPIRTVPLSSDKSSSPSRSFTRELLIVFGLLVLGLPVWLLSTARKPEPVASPPASTDTPIAPPTTPTETIIPEITVQPILLNEKQQAVVTGSVKANGVVKYSVEGKQGQTISLQLLGQGTTMNILNPNGQSVSQQVNNFGDTYRTDGIYTIEVKGTGAETANFTLSVAVIGEPVVQPTEPAPNPEVAPPNTENQSSQ